MSILVRLRFGKKKSRLLEHLLLNVDTFQDVCGNKQNKFFGIVYKDTDQLFYLFLKSLLFIKNMLLVTNCNIMLISFLKFFFLILFIFDRFKEVVNRSKIV